MCVAKSASRQLSIAAAQRQERLANLTSPEFDEWFEYKMAELAAVPFPMFDAFVMARSRGQAGVCITHEPQPDSGKEGR
jgi:hypothetical protein